MEQNTSKRTLILSLVAVLVLVVSVVGVAYAMFSFSATGSQTNVIKTGYVTLNFANESVINLTNALPVADSIGAAYSGSGNQLTFDVTSTINGTMTVDYDLQLSEMSNDSEAGRTLTSNYIKFRLQKSTDGGTNWADVLGSSTTGVTIASRASSAGTYSATTNNNAGTGVTTYAIDSGQFAVSTTVKYKLTAWVASNYTPSVGELTTTPGENTTTQTQGTASESYTFKVRVVAGQHDQTTA